MEFLDTFQFLGTSLDKLVKNLLAKGAENFKVLRRYFPEDKIHLLLRKGVFPYSWFDDVKKFKETQLPPIEAFRNDLTGEDCSIEGMCHVVLYHIIHCDLLAIHFTL